MKRALPYVIVWCALTAALMLLENSSLGKMAATGVRAPRKEARPKRKLPRSHRHKTIKRCLEKDGKTWRRGCA